MYALACHIYFPLLIQNLSHPRHPDWIPQGAEGEEGDEDEAEPEGEHGSNNANSSNDKPPNYYS